MVSNEALVAVLLRPLRRQGLQRLLIHERRVIHDHVALGCAVVRFHSRLSYRRRPHNGTKLMLEFIHSYRILKGTGDLPLKVVVVERGIGRQLLLVHMLAWTKSIRELLLRLLTVAVEGRL